MPKRLFILVFILICIIFTALTASAQSQLTQTFISQDGTIIVRYPEGWESEDYGDGYFYIAAFDLVDSRGEDIYIDLSFISPDVFELDYIYDKDAGESSLEVAIEPFQEDKSAQIETFNLRNRRAARVIFYQEEQVVDAMYIIEFSDGRAGGVYVYVEGNFDEAEQTILDILASFDYAPPNVAGTRRSTVTSTPNFSSNLTQPPLLVTASATVGRNSDFPTPTVVFGQSGSNDVCSVSVSQPRTATVRAGPSAIRPAVLFLPENRNFTVTGSFTAADGTVWYRLDKQEVAPNKSAKELWVSSAQVTASGYC